MTKLLASFAIMILAFLSFAYGQNCTLLPWFSPSILINGDSRTAYSIPEATYTQSCEDARGTITCTNWTVINGNTYKYPNCIDHTWSNCTSPTWANHLEYRRLYSAWTATYTQSCWDLSKNLQCLNGVFTGVPNAHIYTHGTCTDPNRVQCINTRTNTYRDHGEAIVWYLATSPWIGQTCATLSRTLTCYNGTRSGNGTTQQAGLFTGCTNPPSFSPCTNIRNNNSIPHGWWVQAYTSPTSPINGTCADVARPLICINGARSGNGNNQQVGLFSGCVLANTAPCPANVVGLGGGTRIHWSTAVLFTQNIALEANSEICNDFRTTVQCNNGTRIWYTPGLYTGCQQVSSWSCLHPWQSNTYVSHLWFINAYTADTPTASYGCDSVKTQLYCNATQRRLGSWLWIPVPNPSGTYFGSCEWCILPRGSFLPEWSSTGTYSRTFAEFPQTCNQFSTTLTCSGWVLNGNRQMYQYSWCTDVWWLVTGIDLSIVQSPGLPGSKNTSGELIAQWSSPQINILLRNNGTDAFDETDITPGFLTCTWEEEDLVVHASNTISSLVVNPGTQLGINVRIQPIFTQALGIKTLVCKLQWVTNDVNLSNNIWTWVFEIVTAERFDLALRRSIDGISQYIDAPEWATWAQWLQNLVFNALMNVLVPLIIVIGILIAIFGFYKLMFSSDENAIKEGTRYIIYWVLGIIIIVSARFIGQWVYNLLVTDEIIGRTIAQWLYDNIVFPFVKLAIYLVLGVMFVILLTRVITFLFGSDTDAQKKAGTLIWWNVISMLVIIWAKQIIEVIYGKQSEVLQDTTNLGEIWSGILADKNIPILWQIINYALGITALVILVIIILQTVKLLIKPDDPAQIKSIKNSLLYMFIGILVIWAGYLIVNFLIIN